MGENAEREADGGDALPEWEQVSSRAAAASGGRVSASVICGALVGGVGLESGLACHARGRRVEGDREKRV